MRDPGLFISLFSTNQNSQKRCNGYSENCSGLVQKFLEYNYNGGQQKLFWDRSLL